MTTRRDRRCRHGGGAAGRRARQGRPTGHPARRRAAPAVQPDPALRRARGHPRPRRLTLPLHDASTCASAPGSSTSTAAEREVELADRARVAVRRARPGHRQHPDAAADPRPGPRRRSAGRARARVPDPRGLPAARPRGAARRAPRVVVGGGLLGLQVARALARARPRGRGRRGRRPPAARPGRRQGRRDPGPRPAPARHRGLHRRPRRPGSPTTGWSSTTASCSTTDLVVLTAGGRPSTALARRAGLDVRRGVVVDHHLRTSDPHVHAIGDCAQHRDQVTGFVPPAWEQAGLLARAPDRRGRHLRRHPHRRPAARHRPRRGRARRPRAHRGRGRRGDQPGRRLAPQARRPRRRDRGRDAGRRPVPDRADHPALRPRHGPRSGRARRPAHGRPAHPAGVPRRRRRGLRLRGRHRRADPVLHLARRGPRPPPAPPPAAAAAPTPSAP